MTNKPTPAGELVDSSALIAYQASARRMADEEDFEAIVGSVYVNGTGHGSSSSIKSLPTEHLDA